MGLFRKMTSISTLGVVDFRSAKDRTASHTASMARQARKQTRLLRQQTHALQQPAASYMPQLSTPAGWYPCPGDTPGSVRYWDGIQWTGNFKP